MSGVAAERGEADPRVVAQLDQLLLALRATQPHASLEVIHQAYALARRCHEGQARRSGEPYLVHPLRVATTLAGLGLRPPVIAAAVLHDSVEDSDLTVFEVTEQFGRDVASLVDGVTKLGKVPYLSRREQQAESFRKLLLAMAQDIRVLLVKLADRLDNMRTLGPMPDEKKERISRETLDIYVPLARRLGIDWLRHELGDLCLQDLEPASFDAVRQRIETTLASQPEFVDDVLDSLQRAFAGLGDGPPRSGSFADEARWSEAKYGPIELRCTMRSVSAVDRWEGENSLEVSDPADLVSYQVITRSRMSAYAALGRVHAEFSPIPGRFRDYVALPRPNRYRALHTTVVDRHGRRMEVQIRSEAMDAIAERGVAVDLVGAPDAEAIQLEWLQRLMDWQGEVHDPNEFIDAVKAELFADEVYAFTPDGDLHVFPRGATPLDFAFAVHSEVGLHCAGARVNGHVVPLRYRLRQGDTVEIMTSERARPVAEWLKIARSSRARAKIKHCLRQEERVRLRELGRELLSGAMANEAGALDDVSEDLESRLDSFGVSKDRGFDGLLEEVGSGRLQAHDVLERLGHPSRIPRSDESLVARMIRRVRGRPSEQPSLPGADSGRRGSPLSVTAHLLDDHGGVIRLAPCCAPLPGDALVGFLSGQAIEAHVQGCARALDVVDERRVYMSWDPDLRRETPVELQVKTDNAVGRLAEMSRAFSGRGVNIKQANCRTVDGGRRALNTFHLNVRSLEELRGVMAALRGVDGVVAVQRVFHPEAGA
jgi:GTP pyrophosphokinase